MPEGRFVDCSLYAEALLSLPEAIDDQAPLPVPDVCTVTLDKLLSEPDSRRAVLISGLVDYGVFRIYEAYCDIRGVAAPRSFQSRAKALEFLNEGFAPEKHIL